MGEQINRSASSKPGPVPEDLSALAGRWNGAVQVKLTGPMPLVPCSSRFFGRERNGWRRAPSGHVNPADLFGS